MGGGDKSGSGANDERTRSRKESKDRTLGKMGPGSVLRLPAKKASLEG